MRVLLVLCRVETESHESFWQLSNKKLIQFTIHLSGRTMVREASFERGEPGKGLKLSYCSLLCAGKILPHRLVSFYKAGHILTQGPDHMESRADGHIHWDCGSNICSPGSCVEWNPWAERAGGGELNLATVRQWDRERNICKLLGSSILMRNNQLTNSFMFAMLYNCD